MAEAAVYGMREEEVLERARFGAFEVLRSRGGAMFRTYSGYHVWVSRYAAGPDGKAHDKCLYRWLCGLLEARGAATGHEGEELEGLGVSRGEALDAMVVMTEANLIAPLTAFVDEGRAQRLALEYMEWLRGKQEELLAAEEAPAPEEDAAGAAAELDGRLAMEAGGEP